MRPRRVGVFMNRSFRVVDVASFFRGAVISVARPLQPLADGFLFFALGAIVGAVLGGALGPQLSTHAGFRLIDAMQEDSIAVVIDELSDEVLDPARRAMTDGGGLHIICLPSRAGMLK